MGTIFGSQWLMESDKLTGKLARWALLLQEYDFEIVHKAGVQNMDADGLSRNPDPLQDDMTGARWHDISDQEVVSGWHVSSYFAWMEGKSIQVMTKTLREIVDEGGPRVSMDVWKDNGLLYRLQHGEFPPNISYQDRN